MGALSPSSLPSTIADFPASPALGNSSENDGCDSESPATSVKRTDPDKYLPSPSLDCVDPTSVASNMPETPLDYISEDLELDVMKPREAASCDREHDVCFDDMFASHLDELLQADTPQEFVEESNLPCVDDLFPSSQSLGQEFSALNNVCAWSGDSLRGLEAFQFQEDKLSHARPASYCGEDESASQMFERWLQNNAHWISLSDLRKIKLKTSTIENATTRLGGGKKGLMLFLKFVLLWVQNSRLKSTAQLDEALSPSSDGQLGASLVSECVGPSAMNDAPRKTLGGLVHNLTNPFSPLMAGAPPCPDWMTRAQWGQPPLIDQSGAPPIANGHVYGNTDFCRSNNAWLNHRCMLRAEVSPSSLSASGNGSNVGPGVCLGKDATSIMMLMQQQNCSNANPAATTRAARKSRMERQRWSVRHSRRWSASAHQNRLTPTSSAHANSSSWSQIRGNGSQGLLHSSVRSSQQQQMGGRSSSELQQNHKRPEKSLRLLFQKELKQSDVGNLGRIVLPKKAAETCLPPLELRDGLNLLVEDMNSSKVWNMRYRFWPNNKSRMYLLENTSDFVKSYDLKEGDYMMLFCDTLSDKFVIRGAKGPTQAVALRDKECVDEALILCNEVKKRRSSPQEEADCIRMSSANSEDSCEDSLLAELIEQSLEDMKGF